MKHKLNSSVETHKLANQKVMGSILSQAELSFCGPTSIYTSLYTEIAGKTRVLNTRNGGNRISSLTRV